MSRLKPQWLVDDMDKKPLEAFAREAAKSIKIKTPTDLDDFCKMLTKVTVETALNALLDEHLGYEKHSAKTDESSRNGYSSKKLIADDAQVKLDVSRACDSTFEPQLVRKHQTRFQLMRFRMPPKNGRCPLETGDKR